MASIPGARNLAAALLLLALVACSDDTTSPAIRTSSPAATAQAPAAPGELFWTQAAPLPTPRSEVASAVLDGKIYVLGGFDARGGGTNLLEVYDPAGNRWERRAPFPEQRDHPMAAALNGRVYLFGGGAGDATRTTFAYDPGSNTWTRVADMPFRRTAGGAAVLGSEIIVAGGTGDSPETTMIYDPAANRWHSGPRLSEPREHLAVTSDGNSVYVIGGRWQDVLKDTNEVLEATPGATWRRLPSLPTARGGTAAGMVGDVVYVAGGEAFGPERTFPQVEAYDTRAQTWSRLPDLPTPRHGLAVQGINGALYVIGGGPRAGLSVDPHNEMIRVQ